MRKARWGILGVAAAFFAFAMAAAGPVAASFSAVVDCHDPDRGIVQKKLRTDCPADHVVDDARAAELKAGGRFDMLRRRGDVVELSGAVHPRVVRPEGTGTGFYLSRPGLVLTSAHVVAGCGMLVVEGSGDFPARGELVARDDRLDLALLSTEAPASRGFTFRLEALKADEPVLAVGYPVRMLVPLLPSTTDGTFITLHRRDGKPSVLVIRADLYPGNSGGPLIDRAGNVVGIVTAKLDTPTLYKKTGNLVRDIGVAVATESILAFLRRSGVQPEIAPRQAALPPDDLQELAGRSVARITCRR